jgi:hypothetical protein
MGDLNGDYVDPDTYNFKCFDITMRPSDPNARLVPLTESEKIKLRIINEAEETDLLIDGHTPETKQDRVQNDIINNLLSKLQELNISEDLKFIKDRTGIKAKYKDEDFGNIFISKIKSDKNNYQIDKYAVFTNKDKAFGYEYIPSRGNYDEDNYDRIANKLIDSFKSKLPQDEQLELDLNN